MIGPDCYVSPAVVVHDPPTRNTFLIYRAAGPFLDHHRPRRWYVRLISDHGITPSSLPYGTQDEAMAAIRDGSWYSIPGGADKRSIRPRAQLG